MLYVTSKSKEKYLCPELWYKFYFKWLKYHSHESAIIQRVLHVSCLERQKIGSEGLDTFDDKFNFGM